jgi:hypothetical protein
MVRNAHSSDCFNPNSNQKHVKTAPCGHGFPFFPRPILSNIEELVVPPHVHGRPGLSDGGGWWISVNRLRFRSKKTRQMPIDVWDYCGAHFGAAAPDGIKVACLCPGRFNPAKAERFFCKRRIGFVLEQNVSIKTWHGG